jgi:molecular chaperone DnaK (HSP70)
MSKYFVLAGIAVALAAAILAALGFRGRPISVGIDLGTTFSAIVFKVSNEVYIGAPDGQNSSSVASVVALVDSGFIVGRTANALAADHPWSAVFDAKRVIGRNAHDALAVSEAGRHGGRLVMHPHLKRNRFGKSVPPSKWASCDGCQHDLAFVVRHPSLNNNPAAAKHACVEPGSVVSGAEIVGFMRENAPASWGSSTTVLAETVRAGETLVLLTPQAVACLVIGTLVASGKGLGVYPSTAVAAVPADFSPLQREATLEAFTRAGVKVSRLLYEPAAAAVAYGLHRSDSIHNVLVFDMGGGTTDVSILYLQDGAFTLIGSAGDGHLGGEVRSACNALF